MLSASRPLLNLHERLLAAHLYVITPDAPQDQVVEIAAAAVRGGADIVQLRHKALARGELLALARRLRAVIAQAGVLFVVNDHVDIALLSEADGVHLGPDDLSIKSARRVAGDRLLIGASASSPAAARTAIADGADYLGSGPAFATPIKTEKQIIGPKGVAAIAAAVGPEVPVFAIGGIDESNVAQLVAEGLRRVCVIRAISGASDPEQAARRLRAMLMAW
ncbi:MAG TPA: thiamine phosphate synthase [Candidatus Dormibacteraeota bacterium]|nr:thiamine phosphate synthase [Candidatus Dormibacteraeota bacterium]